MVIASQPGTVRAEEVRTWGQLVRVFAHSGSGRVLAATAAGAVPARLALGRWSPGDGAAAAIGLGLAGPAEWLIHRHLFHAPADSGRRRAGLGADHARHHADPGDLGWLLLSPGGAVVLLVAAGGLSTLWSLPLARLVGSGHRAPVVLTGALTAWWAVGHYEWFHLRCHSRQRPRSARARRRVADHLRHHHRDPGRWLGVTSSLGDRLFGTA